MLDAPLIWPDVSRLVIDCNRAADVPSLIVTESEGRKVRGQPRFERWRAQAPARFDPWPYHAAIEACLARRQAAHLPTSLIAIHSYTPVYLGKAAPGRWASCLTTIAAWPTSSSRALKADPALTVGINEPYSPADHVYYTVARHARPRDLPAAMIEIRNDEIGDEAGQRRWAERLAKILFAAEPSLRGARHAMV